MIQRCKLYSCNAKDDLMAMAAIRLLKQAVFKHTLIYRLTYSLFHILLLYRNIKLILP